MAVSDSYTEYIIDCLSGAGLPTRTRKMFGGAGIYVDEAMYGLISKEERFYFKVGDSTRADYEALGMEQFHKMPYFEVSAEILEDSEQLRVWGSKSADIAIATKKPKRK